MIRCRKAADKLLDDQQLTIHKNIIPQETQWGKWVTIKINKGYKQWILTIKTVNNKWTVSSLNPSNDYKLKDFFVDFFLNAFHAERKLEEKQKLPF